MTIEQDVANQIAHREHIAKVLARTGGEIMHPDHYDFRQDFRDAVLEAMDEASDKHSMPRVLDADLSELFRTIDALAERLWLRRLGERIG